MTKKHLHAFTLIELLVVIAIIGILSSVILAALSDAKDQGIAAKVMSEMDSIGKRASIEEQQLLTYNLTCGTGGVPQSVKIAELIVSIEKITTEAVTCNSEAGGYALSVPLSGAHWCVDSTGVRKEILNALTVEMSCS